MDKLLASLKALKARVLGSKLLLALVSGAAGVALCKYFLCCR